uniref:Uncharacterized protein n=1 Tax=Timema monikensis TaxID=170555 RepID=A0A7R9EJ73_9NEOP|nr:unnamed protein product [Timema monikensis]
MWKVDFGVRVAAFSREEINFLSVSTSLTCPALQSGYKTALDPKHTLSRDGNRAKSLTNFPKRRENVRCAKEVRSFGCQLFGCSGHSRQSSSVLNLTVSANKLTAVNMPAEFELVLDPQIQFGIEPGTSGSAARSSDH